MDTYRCFSVVHVSGSVYLILYFECDSKHFGRKPFSVVY